MNIYLIDPIFLNYKRLPLLFDILKVEKVFIFFPEGNIDFEDLSSGPHAYEVINIPIVEDVDVKNAVYRLVNPIQNFQQEKSIPFHFDDSKFRNSNSLNPLFNISHCNESNIMLLCKKSVSQNIVRYAYNILHKNCNGSYDTRICYCQISRSLSAETMLYHKKGWRKLESSKSNFTYDPLIEYIRIKTLESCSKEDVSSSLTEFYLSESGFNELIEERTTHEYDLMYSFRDTVQENDYSSSESEADLWGAKDEMKYILNQGGDWIID